MPKRVKTIAIIAAANCLAVLVSNRASAQATTWTNAATDNLWSNPLNWTGGVPTASIVANFSRPPQGTVIVPNGATARQINVSAVYTFTGGTLATPLVYAVDGAPTFQTRFVPYGGTPTLWLRGGTIQGGISGAQDVTLSDGAKVIAPVSYTGTTSILTSGGTISLGTAGAIKNSSSINVGSRLSLEYTTDSVDRIADAIPLHLRQFGTLFATNTSFDVANERLGDVFFDFGQRTINLTGGSTTGRAMNVTANSLSRTNNALGKIVFATNEFGRNASLSAVTAPMQIGGGGATGTVTRSIVPWLTGTAGTSALPEFITVEGSTLRPLNTNEYAPDLISVPANANVRLATPQVLYSSTVINSLSVNDSGLVDLAGKTLDITSGAISLGMSNTTPPVGPIVGGGQLRTPGEMIITTGKPNGFGAFTIDSSIVASSLTISGVGVVLKRQNNIAGAVTINETGVTSDVQGTLESGTIVFQSGAVSIRNISQSIGNATNGVRVAGSAMIAAPPNLTVTIPGPLTGSGGVASVGNGTLVIAADSPNFTGSVNGFAPIRIDGILGSSTSPVNVGQIASSTGGLLTGRAANIFGTVAGKEIEPGLPIGTMTVQTLVGDGGDPRYSLGIDIVDSDGVAGVDFDQLVVTNSVSLYARELDVRLLDGFAPDLGDGFLILRNDGALPVEGMFIGKPQDSRFVIDNTQFQIDYLGGTGNDVVLTVVPEPGVALLGFGVAAFAPRRRRR